MHTTTLSNAATLSKNRPATQDNGWRPPWSQSGHCRPNRRGSNNHGDRQGRCCSPSQESHHQHSRTESTDTTSHCKEHTRQDGGIEEGACPQGKEAGSRSQTWSFRLPAEERNQAKGFRAQDHFIRLCHRGGFLWRLRQAAWHYAGATERPQRLELQKQPRPCKGF